MKKELTINDFQIKRYISWEELERVFGKKRYKEFMGWMEAQASYLEGVYVHDLERYLAGGKNFLIF